MFNTFFDTFGLIRYIKTFSKFPRVGMNIDPYMAYVLYRFFILYKKRGSWGSKMLYSCIKIISMLVRRNKHCSCRNNGGNGPLVACHWSSCVSNLLLIPGTKSLKTAVFRHFGHHNSWICKARTHFKTIFEN